MSNESGTLYVIATPIGNLEDLTPRALKILKQVKYIAAEDTRHSKKLFIHHGINPHVFSHHKFNERKSEIKLIKFLESGDDIGLISDAGTPLISDPGYGLVKSCHLKGIRVVPVPGPSAIIAALSVAGFHHEPVEERTTDGERDEIVQGVDIGAMHGVVARVEFSSLWIGSRNVATDCLALGHEQPIRVLEAGDLSQRIPCLVRIGARSTQEGRNAFIAKRDVGLLEYVGNEGHVGG